MIFIYPSFTNLPIQPKPRANHRYTLDKSSIYFPIAIQSIYFPIAI